MAKKKYSDHASADSGPALPGVVNEVQQVGEVETNVPAPSEDLSLMDEVQAFLAQRVELATKLAAEIEATEKKLADLRKTAALLFPESTTANAPKDKKPKKPAKPKVLREEEPASPPAEPEAA